MAHYRPRHTPQPSSVAPALVNSPTLGDSYYEDKEKEIELQTMHEFRHRGPVDTGSLSHGVEFAAHLPETETEKTTRKKAQLGVDGTEYPGGIKFHLIMLAICLAVFLMALEYVW